MRLFEMITIVALLATWISYLLPRRPRWMPALPAAAAVTQLVVEGYRWPMAPAYALAVGFAIEGAVAFLRKDTAEHARASLGRRIVGIVAMVFGLLALIVAAILMIELPVFRLPEPTGQYGVGTTSFEMVDTSRVEVYPPNTTDHRDLMIQVWYPTQIPGGARPQTYWTDAYGPYWAANLGLPSFAFDYINSIPTHSYRDAPVASAEPVYPVLIFSHGTGGTIAQNTSQLEELASHGYIVFGIAHPYDSAAIFYPDGRVVPASPGQPGVFPPDPQTEIVTTHAQCVAMTDSAQIDACWRHFMDISPSAQRDIKIWAQDTRFVLDELARINGGEHPSQLSGRLDLEHIGLFGHSFGGATAGEVCSQDSRCTAGANMDGFQYGDVIEHPVKQPFMILYSEDGVGGNDFIYDRVENQAYRVFIKGTRHQNYTDASLELGVPVGQMTGYVGSIDGQRMVMILNRYLVAFFDKHLKDIPSPLLDGPDPAYPEVDFQTRSGLGR